MNGEPWGLYIVDRASIEDFSIYIITKLSWTGSFPSLAYLPPHNPLPAGTTVPSAQDMDIPLVHLSGLFSLPQLLDDNFSLGSPRSTRDFSQSITEETRCSTHEGCIKPAFPFKDIDTGP